jgi:hypothetical protein
MTKEIATKVVKPVKAKAEIAPVKEVAVINAVVKKPVVRKVATKVQPKVAQASLVVETVKAPAAKKAPVVKKAPVEKKAKAVVATKEEKPAKVKKPKLVRDSFTIPETDFALFASIKKRLLAAGVESKKSEILRAALANLAKLNDSQLASAIGLIERIKTGRPKK